MSKLYKRLAAGAATAALIVFLALTCQSADPTSACPMPAPDSEQGLLLERARNETSFTVLYPCKLPSAQKLVSTSTTGVRGRQQTELVFNGPYEMTIRQSQVAPAVSPDPAGASRVDIQLFSNTTAALIERNDGSRKALYHLYWFRNGLYYELQAFGPPLQRRQILQIATSLEP